MSKTVKITKIEITLKDGTTMSLPLEEAKELFTQLEGLFGKKEIVIPSIPVTPTNPWATPINPWQLNPPMWTTCSDSTDELLYKHTTECGTSITLYTTQQ